MAFMQVNFCGILESGEYLKIGDTKPTKVNVRIISATNRNLKQEIENKTFREDLFFRLSVFHIELPPLRERMGDVEILVKEFLLRYSKKMGT